MAVVLALPWLFDQVVARFAAEGTNVPQAFGWREPAKKLVSAPRIEWVPGDDASGDLGEIGAVRYPGALPARSLGTLYERCTVYLESVDSTALENERAQYQATRLLFDAWYRAVKLAVPRAVAFVSARWVVEKKERRFGAALRVVFSIEATLPDAPLAMAPADLAFSNEPQLARALSDPGQDEADVHAPDVAPSGGD